MPDSFLPVMIVILPSSDSAATENSESESTYPILIILVPSAGSVPHSSSTISLVTLELVLEGIQSTLGVSRPPEIVPLALQCRIRMSLIRVEMVVRPVGSAVTPGADADRTSSRAISSSIPSMSR